VPAAAGPDFGTPTPRPHPLAASSGTREITPLDDILFEIDSNALSEEGRLQLASAAVWLQRHPRYRLVLEGYTDASGPRAYNEDLATSRAAAARAHLVWLGIPASRLQIIVYGEAAARAQIDSSARRVIFYATDRPARAVAIASIRHKRALSSVWVERNELVSQSRLPERTIIGSR
jgi:outer membrane protein OmpA-like peptidoglycan-associated protein